LTHTVYLLRVPPVAEEARVLLRIATNSECCFRSALYVCI